MNFCLYPSNFPCLKHKQLLCWADRPYLLIVFQNLHHYLNKQYQLKYEPQQILWCTHIYKLIHRPIPPQTYVNNTYIYIFTAIYIRMGKMEKPSKILSVVPGGKNQINQWLTAPQPACTPTKTSSMRSCMAELRDTSWTSFKHPRKLSRVRLYL